MRILGLAAALLLLAACQEEEIPYDGPPIADAGADVVVAPGQYAQLSAEGSFCPTNRSCTYTWYIDSAPVASALDDSIFGDANGTEGALEATMMPDTREGSFVVGLVVEDGVLTSRADLAVVTVVSENVGPVAECGADQAGMVGERLYFDGSQSSDPEGAELSYEWSVVSSPEGAQPDLYEANEAQASLIPDVAGSYVLGLRVSDGLEDSSPCFVSAQVEADTSAPLANAGESITLTPCEDVFQLNGNASWDPDGDALSYSWSLLDVPEGSAVVQGDISDPTSATPFVPVDLPGDYTFGLQVHDGQLVSAQDLVTHTATDLSENRPPRVDAGPDVVAEASPSLVSGCREVTVAVDGTASMDPNGDPVQWQWTASSPELEIVYPELPWTEVTLPRLAPGESRTWTLTLTGADCQHSDEDTVSVELTCLEED